MTEDKRCCFTYRLVIKRCVETTVRRIVGVVRTHPKSHVASGVFTRRFDLAVITAIAHRRFFRLSRCRVGAGGHGWIGSEERIESVRVGGSVGEGRDGSCCVKGPYIGEKYRCMGRVYGDLR